MKKHSNIAVLTLIVLMWLGKAGLSYAQNVKAEHLIIDFAQKGSKAPEDSTRKKKLDKNFKMACNSLGKALTVGKGPWGIGIFTGFSCFKNGKKISGKGEKTPWKLTIKNSDPKAHLVLAKDEVELASITLKYSETNLEIFQDPEFTDYTAFSLLEQMPYAIQIDRKSVSKSAPIFKGRHWKTSEMGDFKYKVPQPAKVLILYRIVWDEDSKIYHSQVIGKATQKAIIPPVASVKKKGKKKSKILTGGEVQYEIPQDIVTQLNQGPVWAQDENGPGARTGELNTGINDAHGEITNYAQSGQLKKFLEGKTGLISNLLESAASGYVGMRFGVQVLPAEGELGRLLNGTKIFNLIAEFRGGPVKGLRYYYDKLPETKMKLNSATGDKVEAKIAFARHVLGYSWDFDPGLGIINNVTVDPKLGVWTFNAFLPVGQDENGLVTDAQEFSLGSTLSLSIEIGLEKNSDWYTLRAYYANDSGFSLLKQGAKVTSNRFGSDAFFKAGPQFSLFSVPVKTALLASFVLESVTIRKGVGFVEAGKETISGISYIVGYAGGGVAISW